MNSHESLSRSNRRAAIVWGVGVVAFLGLQLVLGFSAIALSKSDPTVAVVPDYYQRSLDWDAAKQRRAESDALGWQVHLVHDGHADLRIAIDDAQGVPVDLATANVLYFRHARASEVKTQAFGGHPDGILSLPQSLDHPGWWTIELTAVDRVGAKFTHRSDFEVPTRASTVSNFGASTDRIRETP